jgi:predicted acylesterase/phospholipase RssA
MDELRFTPKDHDPKVTGSEQFDAGKHNWMRGNKAPALVLNATTVNTGRGWQFKPTWMGESPWVLSEGADNIERLEWANYNTKAGWWMRLARAVAASACVPGIFAPLKMDPSYETVDVELVDGGVYDNQGVAALLAMNCNVLMVSDASGQLKLERKAPTGLSGIAQYAQRAMDILMERVRQATYADLDARRLTGLVRGLMFQHMKEGLDADTIRLPFSQETYQIERTVLSPSGVRKEYQKALGGVAHGSGCIQPGRIEMLDGVRVSNGNAFVRRASGAKDSGTGGSGAESGLGFRPRFGEDHLARSA